VEPGNAGKKTCGLFLSTANTTPRRIKQWIFIKAYFIDPLSSTLNFDQFGLP